MAGLIQAKYLQTQNTSSQICVFISDNTFIPEYWFTADIPTNTEQIVFQILYVYLKMTTISYLSVGLLQATYTGTLNIGSQICVFITDNNFIPECRFTAGNIRTNTEHKFLDISIYI